MTVCGTLFGSLVPNLEEKIERLIADPRHSATDGNMFPIFECALVIDFELRQNDAVGPGQRFPKHLVEVNTSGCLCPYHIGGVVHVLQHVDVAKRNTKRRNASNFYEPQFLS